MKKTLRKLLCFSAIFAMLFTSCDFLNNLTGGKQDDPEKTTLDNSNNPDTFSGKEFSWEANDLIIKFTFKDKFKVDIYTRNKGKESSVPGAAYRVDESNNILEIEGFGLFKYNFRGLNLLLKIQDEDNPEIFEDFGTWFNTDDKSIISDESAKTNDSTSMEWNYKNATPLLEVPSNVTDITIKTEEDLDKKTLYLISANSGSTIIPKDKIRNIRHIKSGEIDRDLNKTEASSPSSSILPNIKSNGITYFQEEYINIDDYAERDDSIDAARASVPSVVKDYKVGDKKDLWINKPSTTDSKNYEKLQATLHAVGTHCYVWILDEFYADNAGGAKVNKSIAETYSQKFDSIYELEHAVFGSESEVIRVLYKNKEGKWVYKPNVDIATKSDTGSMVNIVIYDVDYDYEEGTTNPAGTAGFFYSKDYYFGETEIDNKDIAIYNKSNLGKYIYMDSSMANYRKNDSYSTLSHEFNHMITCGMKEIPLNTTEISTNFNEMLAMVCEDMMKDYLELKNAESPLARLETFNSNYYRTGVGGWKSDDATVLTSYADTYVFGAWLFRQYGGAELAKTMLENVYINRESIVSAVNTLNDTSYSYKNLFEQFLLALTGDKTYTLNKDARTGLTCNGYNFPMKAIDIYDIEFSEDKVEGRVGPRAFNILDEELAKEGIDLQNDYGFIIQNLAIPDTVSAAKEIQLTVDSTTNSDNLLYIIIE